MNQGSRTPIVVGIIAAAAVAGVLWWQKHKTPPPPPVVTAPAAAPAPPPVAPIPPATAPAIRHPIAIAIAIAPASAGASDKGTLPSLDQADGYVKNLLFDLLGRKAVSSFLGVDDFVRHFVATVGNLATDHAPAQMWPVNRTDGHFLAAADAGGAGMTVGAANAARYAAFVGFAAAIDTAQAVAVYRRLYPLFQQAYEELGFPGKYFNDRLIEVIDDLLATPDVAGPIKVKRVEVPGATGGGDRAPRAGGLYVFEDPALESRTAGQKILLRMGRENAARLKAKLADVRGQLAGGPAPAPPRP